MSTHPTSSLPPAFRNPRDMHRNNLEKKKTLRVQHKRGGGGHAQDAEVLDASWPLLRDGRDRDNLTVSLLHALEALEEVPACVVIDIHRACEHQHGSGLGRLVQCKMPPRSYRSLEATIGDTSKTHHRFCQVE